MEIFVGIILHSIIPIFILIFLGYIIDKKITLDVKTLTKLNFFIFVPAFSFVNIYSTEISIDLLRVIMLTIVLLIINYMIGMSIGRLMRIPVKTRKAFENSVMFTNSGNIGLSLMTLVFTNPQFNDNGNPLFLEIALSVQVMTLLVQNLTTNTVGFINSGGEGMTLKKGVVQVLKMPTIYAIALAVLLKLVPIDFTLSPMWPSLVFLRNGLIAVGLLTLGVQLSGSKINLKMYTPYVSTFCRLIIGPAIAFVLIKLFGFEGVMAQAILIASSTPSAINTSLIAVETDGDKDFAVQAVMISTLLSAFTLSTVVYLAYYLF